MDHLKKLQVKMTYTVSAVIGKERYDFVKANDFSISKILRDAIDKLMEQVNAK